MAFTLALIVLTLGSIMVFSGHDWAGGILISIDLVGLATVFVTAKVSQRHERETKYELPKRK